MFLYSKKRRCAAVFSCLLTFSLGQAVPAWGQNVIITGLEDYNMGIHTVGSGDKVMTATVCVGKDAGTTEWDLTANGSGVGGIFTLDDGVGNTVTFTVDHLPATPITAGVTEPLDNADNTAPLNCDGVDNQSFRVTLPGNVLDGAPAGTYTGYVEFTATP